MDEHKPGPLEWSIGSGLIAAAVVTGVLAKKWWICLILLGVLLLFVGGYIAWRMWKRRQNEKNFSGEMDQQSSNAGVSKVEQKAQLDQLRRAFQEGILVYKKRKKDVYSVPWYLMIGTSGSGKTEAIRHSEIGFPPGLTDPLAGVGGTINMNWWFTNYGVILDTAGKMVFPESGAGQSGEWDEFLKLLRKHRAACPINGLFLALDVDKMIKDSSGEISRKASEVHKQLDCIQRALDVRFPVYLLVTKSDFLTGFKEYFEGIDDPQLQNQILGWSNKGDLDEAVDPDAIERHLLDLVEMIKRRRLAVVRNPVNLDLQQNRRLDCTDATFAFPASLERLIPRLKRYLQIVFSTGQFSSKPVFLRGIYFTSSMQQNGDLDEALAEFMGLKVTDLPTANVQENAKSYFLRDLFIEKAFPERLVTSASNTRRMRRNRLFILCGLAVLILGTLITFSLLGYRAFDRSVATEELLWQEGSSQWQQPSYALGESFWHPIVVLTNEHQWHYAGDDRPFTNFPDLTLADFHNKLASRVRYSSNNVPLIFRPLRGLRRDLKFPEGQRVLVEHSILLPLLDSARYKMSGIKAANVQDTDSAIRLRKALACLIQTQADVDAGPVALSDAAAQEKLSSFIAPLVQFTVDTNQFVNSNLMAACAWTYSGGAGSKDWPPRDFLRGSNNLASDEPLNNGLDCLIAQVRKNQQQVEDHLYALTTICSNLSAVESAEQTLYADAKNDCALTPEHFAAWKSAANALQSSIKEGGVQGVWDPASAVISLQAAADKIDRENSAASSEAFTDILRGAEAGIQANKRPLFADIKTKCQESAGKMQSRVESALANYRRYLSNWDAGFLALDDTGKSYFQQRNDLYRKASALRNPDAPVPVGALQATLTAWQTNLESFNGQIGKYNGPSRIYLQEVCKCAINSARQRGQDGLLSNYWAGAEAKLNAYNNAPVSIDGIRDSHAFFTNMDNDLGFQFLQNLSPIWQDTFQKLQKNEAFVAATRLDKFARQWNDLLNGEAAFPVVFNSATSMTAAQVARLKDDLNRCAKEFSQIQDAPTPTFKTVKDRLSVMLQVVAALAPDPALKVLNQMAAHPGLDTAANQCPYAYLTIGDQSAVRLDLSKHDTPIPLSHLAKSLEIKVTNKPDPDAPNATVFYSNRWENWGPLKLITSPNAKIEEGKWIVPLNVKNSDGSSAGHVDIELEFDPPLPTLQSWQSLNLNSTP